MIKYKIDDLVELNVGGVNMTTYKSTLLSKQTEGSMLSAMFSGRHALKQDATGRYFIDRPYKPFRWIIDTLRTGEFIPPQSDYLKKQIQVELAYFGLTGPLFDRIFSLGIDTETSIDENEYQTIIEWIGRRSLELLYSATKHGWDTKEFHSKCDNKGTTLIIAESECGFIFGGYTQCNWLSNNSWFSAYHSSYSWIYSFRFSNPVRIYANTTTNQIGNFPNQGPTFSSDIVIIGQKVTLNSSIYPTQGQLIGKSSVTLKYLEVYRVF